MCIRDRMYSSASIDDVFNWIKGISGNHTVVVHDITGDQVGSSLIDDNKTYLFTEDGSFAKYQGYDYIVFKRGMYIKVKDENSGKIVYESINPTEAINYTTGNLLEAHETLLVKPLSMNYSGEINYYKSQHLIFPYLYVKSNGKGGDVLSNFYQDNFEDGILIANIESDNNGNLLGAAIKEGNGAYIRLSIKNISESGAYIVRTSNSEIYLKTNHTGYAATAGMEGAMFEGGSNNLIFAFIYDAYRDGLALYSSHGNIIYGKVRKTGRHGIVLDSSHNNTGYITLEDIRARAGMFGSPDGIGMYIRNSYNNTIITSNAYPSYNPEYDVYIEGGSNNYIKFMSMPYNGDTNRLYADANNKIECPWV